MEECIVLGNKIAVSNMNEMVKIIKTNLKIKKGKYICVCNVHTTVMSYENNDYKKVQDAAWIRLPDGKPLSIVSKIKGYKDASRITGPDLMEELFDVSQSERYVHFFYGSTPEVLAELQRKLKVKYPMLKIAGTYSPPFREISEEEDKEIVKMINEKRPDFLWVGLGAPKQEVWMYEHKDKINSLMVGVGAGFDFHAGNVKRAPKIFQVLCLEWLYRLLQDPKRLWKRYLSTNFKFIKYYFERVI